LKLSVSLNCALCRTHIRSDFEVVCQLKLLSLSDQYSLRFCSCLSVQTALFVGPIFSKILKLTVSLNCALCRTHILSDLEVVCQLKVFSFSDPYSLRFVSCLSAQTVLFVGPIFSQILKLFVSLNCALCRTHIFSQILKLSVSLNCSLCRTHIFSQILKLSVSLNCSLCRTHILSDFEVVCQLKQLSLSDSYSLRFGSCLSGQTALFFGPIFSQI